MKNHPFLLVAFLLFPMSFQSIDCVAQKEFKSYSVRGTMFLNEHYTTRPFSKVLVVTGLFDKTLNEKILDEFEKIGLTAINSLKIIPPVKEYSESELMHIYRNHSIDGVITAEVKDIMIVRGVATYEIELSFFDVESNMNAVIFTGCALSTSSAPDKGMHKFFRAIVKELPPIISL